ncbi:hypothetical protein C8A05DRAFT_39931 [Staphylotrichum tortipilum]|uniref:Uncharacterized protein n=1 Tax=Staphylotrichum tortipilum TaxID=2831512 RepID=A0AAN6MAK9_9PEZI|nr:hypothetical protein C8A05DRAFT_39931 [Staphylotrichum longicolle]
MRARVPSALAIAQVVLRIVSSGCSLLALVMLVYCSANYGKDFPVGYVAAVVAPVFDFAQDKLGVNGTAPTQRLELVGLNLKRVGSRHRLS